MIGRVYLERGEPVEVLMRWNGKGNGGRGPRNVAVRRADGTIVVRPFRGLRKPPETIRACGIRDFTVHIRDPKVEPKLKPVTAWAKRYRALTTKNNRPELSVREWTGYIGRTRCGRPMLVAELWTRHTLEARDPRCVECSRVESKRPRRPAGRSKGARMDEDRNGNGESQPAEGKPLAEATATAPPGGEATATAEGGDGGAEAGDATADGGGDGGE